MSEFDDGGSAFPNEGFNGWGQPETGMTLRDYFAAKAMQGFCANPSVFAPNGRNGWTLVNCTVVQLSEVCYGMADGLLKARKSQ